MEASTDQSSFKKINLTLKEVSGPFLLVLTELCCSIVWMTLLQEEAQGAEDDGKKETEAGPEDLSLIHI